MADILESSNNREITIQLLQTATLLAHNLVEEDHKSYLLSSRFFSQIVSYPFDFTDEEIVENYISYLKGLAINISKHQLITFLLKKSFSLFAGAMMFFNYKDSLVRTASRTIILTLVKRIIYIVNHDLINLYLLDSGFFFTLVNNIRQQLTLVNNLEKIKTNEHRIELHINEIIDLLYYMNDIFDQDHVAFTNKLASAFILTIFPVLISSLIIESNKSFQISRILSLTIILQILTIIKSSTLADSLAIILLSPEIPKKLYEICNKSPAYSPPDNVVINIARTIKNNVSEVFFDIFRNTNHEEKDQEIVLAVFIIQAIIENNAISKEILENLKILPQRFLKKQTLLSGILGENKIFSNEYSEKIVGMLLSVFKSDTILRFMTYHCIFRILYELTCAVNCKINEEHESMIKSFLYRQSISIQVLCENELHSKILVELFDVE